MKTCAKCGTHDQITDHHIYPKHHFHGDGQIAHLCFYCHRRLEDIILGIEAFCGERRIGERYKLKKQDYENILLSFLPRRYDKT
jgi:hypothetical protein